MPFDGQTTSNHTKLSMPLRSPLDFSAYMPLDMSNGSSRRVASGHQILPTSIKYQVYVKCEIVPNAARTQHVNANVNAKRAAPAQPLPTAKTEKPQTPEGSMSYLLSTVCI
jgi:hypothetical protein